MATEKIQVGKVLRDEYKRRTGKKAPHHITVVYEATPYNHLSRFFGSIIPFNRETFRSNWVLCIVSHSLSGTKRGSFGISPAYLLQEKYFKDHCNRSAPSSRYSFVRKKPFEAYGDIQPPYYAVMNLTYMTPAKAANKAIQYLLSTNKSKWRRRKRGRLQNG